MVICPHTVISLVKTDLQTAADPDNLVENFWQVDYDSFWSCNVDTSNPSNRLFFKCEDPRSLHYEQFIFQSFGIGNRPTFQKGKTHYFVCKCQGYFLNANFNLINLNLIKISITKSTIYS